MSHNVQHARPASRLQLSIVVPLFNEAGTLDELHRRLTDVLNLLGLTSELIYVDDGSTDGTTGALTAIAALDSVVRPIILARNYGQTAALAAGFDAASGEVIVAMDGDLQHAPEEIPKLLDRLDDGYDIVSGWREQRVDKLWTRRLPSKIANWLMAKLSGVSLHDFGTTFKAYRAPSSSAFVFTETFIGSFPHSPAGVARASRKSRSPTSRGPRTHRTTDCREPGGSWPI
jgi:glycosyltransferase involved in cell wall biosynthesis